MPWAAAAGALVGSVANKALSNGGAGTNTASKDPWSEAVPWLKANIAQGQSLQNQYQATPFNQQQLNAYANMGNQAQYANSVVPDLLGQISGQQLGFDRSNPSALPTTYNFNGLLSSSGSMGATTATGSGGLLSMLQHPAATAGGTSAMNPPAPQVAATSQPAQPVYDPDEEYRKYLANSIIPRGGNDLG